MSTFPNSPRLIKGGLAILDAASSRVLRLIALQYNPDTLTRSYQVQGAGGDAKSERAQPFRLKGPASEQIKLEAEIDAADALEFPDRNAVVTRFGIGPELAALESLVNPTSRALQDLNAQSQSGTLEIIPSEPPLVLFIWSASRIVPVSVSDFSVTEEAFDPSLNPIRAKVSLGMRVLTVDDLGYAGRGGAIFLSHLRAREALASNAKNVRLAALDVSRLP
jgi:hypothetical protein